MDEDFIIPCIMLLMLLFIFSLPVSITACIAASNTRKWAKTKAITNARANGILLPDADAENDPLVDKESDSDSDSEPETEFLDSEDEEHYNKKCELKRREREGKKADLLLSTRAKFLKEWKACWSGPKKGTEAEKLGEQKFKELEEHRKIAREAVREYLRVERKKARKALRVKSQQGEEGAEALELPTYGKVVGEKAM